MLFTFGNGVPLMRWGRQWCGIFHYHWWTASIKPTLLFPHADCASWGLSLSSVSLQHLRSRLQTTQKRPCKKDTSGIRTFWHINGSFTLRVSKTRNRLKNININKQKSMITNRFGHFRVRIYVRFKRTCFEIIRFFLVRNMGKKRKTQTKNYHRLWYKILTARAVIVMYSIIIFSKLLVVERSSKRPTFNVYCNSYLYTTENF